jgi:putative membrane protein
MLWLPGFVRNVGVVYGLQLATFVVLLLVLLWPPAARSLVPARVRRENSERFAARQFHDLGLHRTRDATGVMIFVSLAERHVQVMADRGIDAKVAPDTWTNLVGDLAAAIRAGRLCDGLVAAIEASGALLAAHFPRAAGDRNELPDRVVEV